MFVFEKIANNLENNPIESILKKIFSEDFIKDWIIETIQTRLFEEGEDGTGKVLRTNASFRKNNKSKFYSDFTISLKKIGGDKTSNVTLKDTGEFYRSFEITAKNTLVEIKADFEKDDGNIFKNFTKQYSSKQGFEDSILEMNEQEWSLFIDNILLPRMVTRYINIMTNV
jgi:hypothetical protein